MLPIESVFPPHAMAVVQALAAAGFETRAVGGAVRNWLQGQPPPADLDLATTATPAQAMQALRAAQIPIDDTPARYGALVVWPLDATKRLDLTSLRTDTYLPGSRYPTVAFTTDWAADAARRDFTFNAISVSHRAEVYDPFGGEADLAAGVVKFIGDPLQKLREDPLRAIRFCRLCAVYGLGGITYDLTEHLRLAAPAFGEISRKKLAEELQKLHAAPHAAKVINWMKHQGLWQALPAGLTTPGA